MSPQLSFVVLLDSICRRKKIKCVFKVSPSLSSKRRLNFMLGSLPLFGFFNISNSGRLVIHYNHGPFTREEEGIEKTLGMRLQCLTHAAYQQTFALYNLHVKMVQLSYSANENAVAHVILHLNVPVCQQLYQRIVRIRSETHAVNTSIPSSPQHSQTATVLTLQVGCDLGTFFQGLELSL